MILLQLSDFIDGKYNIPAASSSISATNSELQGYIDRYEKQYIYMLLGVELGDSVIAYIASPTPANTDYDKIINPFAENTTLLCGGFIQSMGLKEYLQAAIFYEYTKDMAYIQTLAGTAKPSTEVATEVSASAIVRNSERVFNSVIDTAEAIQSVCHSKPSAYSGFSPSRISVKGHLFFI